MKKSILARGFIGSVASLLGVVAMGCSGEVMDEATAGNGEIGSVEQAISAADVAANANDLPVGSAFGTSCVINSLANGTGTDYLVVVPGLEGAADYEENAYLLDGATWRGPFALPAGMAGGTANAAAATLASDKRVCILGGGEDGANISQIAKLEYTTSGGNPALTITKAGDLPVATQKLKAVPCGDSAVAFMGGNAGVDSMYVWFGQTGDNTIPTLRRADGTTVEVMDETRTEFDVVSVDSLHFAVGGGLDSGGNRLDTVEAFTVQSDATLGCKLADNIDPDAHYTLAQTFTSPRKGVRGYLQATGAGTATVVFVAGDELVSGVATASADESTFTINWTTPASTVKVSDTTDLAQAVIEPALAKVPGGNAFIAGGRTAATTGVANFQENDGAPWSSVTTRTNSTALPVRIGATMAYVPSLNKVVVVGGHAGGSPASFTNAAKVDLITP